MKNIATALVKAQQAFGPALKTATNPHLKSKYANLSDCIEAVIGALNANGIAMVQKTHEVNPDGVTVETIFMHESGEQISSGMLYVPAPKKDPQGYGSALTYARRYSLMAACGIAPEDDDGHAASQPRKAQQQQPEKQQHPQQPALVDQIRAAVAKGGKATEKAAAHLAALTQHDLDAVWKQLSGEEQEILNAVWPATAA